MPREVEVHFSLKSTLFKLFMNYREKLAN